MRKAIITLVLATALASCSGSEEATTTTAGLANPASVFCEEQGGSVDIRTSDDGGQFGVCVFADGSEVEEWAYFRGEATPEIP